MSKWALIFLALNLVLSGLLYYTRRTEVFEFGSDEYVQADCLIFDKKGNLVKEIGFDRCLFFDDGRVFGIVYAKHLLLMVDPMGREIWRRNLYAHHQTSLVRNGNAIAVISREEARWAGRSVETDGLYIFSLNGELLAEWHLKDHLNQILKILGLKAPDISLWSATFTMKAGRADQEVSHANSVQEIPVNLAAREEVAFSRGNILLNLYGPLRAYVILSPDLRRIEWARQYPDGYPDAHDLQILPSGRLLSYFNLGPASERSSSIAEVDPLTGAIQWLYPGPGIPGFFTENAGSASIVHEKYLLFSDGTARPTTRLKIVDRNGRVMWEYEGRDPGPEPTDDFLTVRLEKLGPFLRNNRM